MRELWDYAYTLPWRLLADPTREGFAAFARQVLMDIHPSWHALPLLVQLGSIVPTLLLLYAADEYDLDFVPVDTLLIRIVAWLSFLAAFAWKMIADTDLLWTFGR